MTDIEQSRSVDVDELLGGYVLTVVQVVRETADSVSIGFEVPDEHAAQFTYLPGQFLTLAVPSEGDGIAARCYSLCSAPGVDRLPMVTVKRVAGGYASNWLNDHVSEGVRLRVLPPTGTFVPNAGRGHRLLFAAGSGITPIYSIVKETLATTGDTISLFYANQDRAATIFAAELDALAQRYSDRLEVTWWYADVRGLPKASDLLDCFPGATQAADIMVCGPAPFMDAVSAAAGSLPHGAIEVMREEFRSLESNPFALVVVAPDDNPASLEVTLDGITRIVAWPRDATLVDALLASELRVPYSCREGTCGSCMCLIEEGEVEHPDAEALDEDDRADGYILGCQARPATDLLKVRFL